jgi:RHH-type rel operon transcriptional repressor/antitoxin RelB
MKASPVLSVRLRPDLDKKLNRLCEKTHRSKSFYVQAALEEFLKDQEEYLTALSAYEDYLKSGKKALSLEEMKKKYLDDDRSH